MNVTDFFKQSIGKWFSQRTHHHATAQTPESGKSDIYIEWLDPTAPSVVQLCNHHKIAPATALGGLQMRWEGIVARLPDKQKGTALLVIVADEADPLQGQVLQTKPGSMAQGSAVGRYCIGPDEALTLTTHWDDFLTEERIWFASENLRLRTRVLKTPDGVSTAAFYSEIRMGGS